MSTKEPNDQDNLDSSSAPPLTKEQEELLFLYITNVFNGVVSLEEDFGVPNETTVMNSLLIMAKFAVGGSCSREDWQVICLKAFDEAEKQERAFAQSVN